MTRKQVQLLILAIFLTVASSTNINSPVLLTKWNDTVLMPRIDVEEENPTHDDYLYVVHDKKNIPCIMANMSIKVTLPYKTGGETKAQSITVPPDAKANGTCSDLISEMKLTWKEKEDKNSKDNIVSFTFLNDHTSFSLFSINASIYLDNKNFPAAEGDKRLNRTSVKNLGLFSASVKDGRHTCAEETKQNVEDAEFSISDVTLIAFNRKKDISSRKEEKCSGSKKHPTFPYVLTDDEKKACSFAKMSVSLRIPYSTKDSEVKNGTIKVRNDAEVSGNCGTTASKMILTWTEEPSTFDSNAKNRVMFSFLKNNGITYVNSIGFEIFLDEKNFPDAKDKTVSGETSAFYFDGIFKSRENELYSCEKVTTVDIGSSTMSIEDVLLVPFDVENDFLTKTVVDCKTESLPSFNYILKDPKTDVPCILANMTLDMKVPYLKTDSKMGTGTLTVPPRINATGECGNFFSTMRLSWREPETEVDNTMVFYVGQNVTHFYVIAIEVDINFDKEHFPDAADQGTNNVTDARERLNLFAADYSTGLYSCVKNETIKIGDIELTMGNVAFIAFNKDEDVSGRTVQNCLDEPDTTPATSSTTESTTETTNKEDSTTIETTPAVVSTPAPDESVKKFKYFEIDPETGVACIMANATISINISYKMKNSETATGMLLVPDNARAKAECGSESSTLNLIWTENNKANFDSATTENTLTFTFQKKDSTFSIDSIGYSLYLDETNFPNANTERIGDTFKSVDGLFSSPVKQLFRCAPVLKMSHDSVDITIRNIALIAFNTEKSVSSISEVNCVPKEEEESNVGLIIGVCIACGALAGLAVAGVMWYMKKRRLR